MTEGYTDSAVMSFKIEGEKATTISAETLVNVLSNINGLVMDTKDKLYPDEKIKLQVIANERGSFNIVLDLLTTGIMTMCTDGNLLLSAKTITDTIINFFKIKNFIGNKKAKVEHKGTDCVITNSDGAEAIFDNSNNEVNIYMEGPLIENNITNIINTVDSEDNAEGISLNSDTQSYSISKDRFHEINKVTVEEHEMEIEEIESIDTYYVKQLDLIGDSQWTFKKIDTIKAKILDEEWLTEFHNGNIDIKPGAKMKMRIKTILPIGKNGIPITRSDKVKCEILEVLEVIPPSVDLEQISIN